MFKAHKDTEKAPGMFGTLVICLPSAHTGGSVKVKHAGQEKTFRSEELGQSYVCWFADVTHEVAKIKSGYRWVLTYNLVNKSPSPDKANLIPGIERHLLRSALREWWDACLVDPTEERAYCYILEHQYTDANLGFDSLKGQDAAKVRALRESCQDGNFCCLLANLHREVWGACVAEDPWPGRVHHNTDMSGALSRGDFHVIDQDEEITTKLNHVLDQDGTWVGEEIPISEDAEIIQFKPFRRDPDDEDFMGYTGNEGAQATHTYRDSVVVVMPRPHLAKFLLGRYLDESRYWKWSPKEYLNSPQDVRYVVNHLRRLVETNPTDEACRLDLEKAARFILDKERAQGRKSLDYCVSQAVRCSFTLRNSRLFEDAALLVRQKLEDEAIDDIVAWIRQSGLTPLEKALGQCFSSEQRVHARYSNLQDFLRRVRNVNEAADEVKELNLDAWVETFMNDSVENCQELGVDDAPVLAQMVKTSSQPQKTLDR
ncbi:hypothetical protein BFW01_g4625 [Lasiodiplodia theobromae]|nr:hypothetical protein BFW01_g4625 [Lasiodiplodia theobromae]